MFRIIRFIHAWFYYSTFRDYLYREGTRPAQTRLQYAKKHSWYISTRKCMKKHDLQSVCMAERFVLFHNTRFRVALSYHEYWCPKCRKPRKVWFVNK